ncbi:MAG: hypothetical protein ABIR96_09100 [Bdellovibrionota bacterium]
MKRISLIALLILATQAAHAQLWDASFDAGLRTYPWGAALGLQGGYSVPAWGDTSGIAYGFTRVGARVQTSGVVNNFEAKLSVFPISFWGLELKSGWGNRRLDDISTLDCATLQCSGSITRTSLATPLYFGAGPYFGRVKLEYTWISATEATNDFLADENTSLIVRSSGDEMRHWELLGGLRWREDFKTLAFYDTIEAQKTSSHSKTYGVIAQKSWDFHTLYIGAGIYESSTTSPHGQLFLSYVMTFAKGLGF